MNFVMLVSFAALWKVHGLVVRLSSEEAQRTVGSLAVILALKDDQANQRWPNTDTTILKLMLAARYRRASDSRDEIYSLVALSSEEQPLPYPPTYKKDPSTLFFEFTAHTIQQQRNLTILGTCIYGMSRIVKPTWVPDYSLEEQHYCDLTLATQPFCASGNNTCEVSIDLNHQALVAHGIILEQIKDLSVGRIHYQFDYVGDKDRKSYLSRLDKQKEQIDDVRTMVASSLRYLHKDEQWEAFWRLLVGDGTDEQTRATPDFGDDVKESCEIVDTLSADYQTSRQFNPNMLERVLARLALMVIGRQLRMTESGLVGWVPDVARK